MLKPITDDKGTETVNGAAVRQSSGDTASNANSQMSEEV